MTNRFLIFIVSASLMLGSGFSCSETVEHGFEAYKRGDFSNALRIFRLAAEQGDPDAQNNLGMRYMEGDGVPQDNTYAHMWFDISASNESEKAAMNRGIVAEKMTEDQIAQAQKLARECVKKNYKDC